MTTTSTADTLMASLMMSGDDEATANGAADNEERSDSPDQDLFGDVPLDDAKPAPLFQDEPVSNAVTNGANLTPPVGVAPPLTPPPSVPTAMAPPPAAAPPPPQPAAAPTPEPQSGLLAQSGLLDDLVGGGDGTLGLGAGDAANGDDDDDGGLFAAVDKEEEDKRLAEEQRKRKEQEAADRLRKQQEEAAAAAERARLEQQHLQQQQQRQQQLLLQQQQQQQAALMQQNPMAMSMPAPMMNQQQLQPQMQPQQNPMMHSMMAATPTSAATLNQNMQSMTLHNQNAGTVGGFYRDHSAQSNARPGASATPSNSYAPAQQNMMAASTPTLPSASTGNYFYATQQQPQQPQQQQQQQQFRASVTQPTVGPGTTTAGMYNGNGNMGMGSMGKPRKFLITKPPEVNPKYIRIAVTEPMLIQESNFLITKPPYWSYQITSTLANNGGTWLVRRRFRHIVAFEDRLRLDCPGSILPPRPEKHATRAIEEASAQQSPEFALQRAKEIETYLNQCACHPIAGHSFILQLFLGLQDDIGTAWPEVSNNAFTRLGAKSAGMSIKVADSVPGNMTGMTPHEWEDHADILALQSSEELRMGAVSQAVPKLEGTVTLIRDHGDIVGGLGMEYAKLSKIDEQNEKQAKEIMSNGLLRDARRTKRLALELSAALEPFMLQYKLVKYEKMAFGDRKAALTRKLKERRGADYRATQLMQQQRQLQVSGQFGALDNLQRAAIRGDEMAMGAASGADDVAGVLREEVNRVAYNRRNDWQSSMKKIAISCRESHKERQAIWESTLEAFNTAFPELQDMPK